MDRTEMASLKWVAVLALAAGCATEPEQPVAPAASAVAAAQPAAPADAKPETFETACRRHLAAVRKWSVHSFPDEAVKGVPAAMAFVAEHADAHGHAVELADLRYRILETLMRGRDYVTGLAYAKAFYADAKANDTHRGLAAEYLAMGLVETKGDYAAADALYRDLLEPKMSKPESLWAIAGLVRRRAYLYVLRGDKKGAIAYIDGERGRLPGNDGFKNRANALLDDSAAEVFEKFFDYRGEVDYLLSRGNRGKAFDVLNRSKLSDVPLMDRLSREIVASDDCEPPLRTRAWLWLSSRDAKFCEENLSRCLDRTAASTNAFLSHVSRTMFVANLSEVYGSPSPAYHRNPAGVVWLWERYLPVAKAARAEIDFRAAQYAALAYSELGDKAKAAAAAGEGLTAAKIRPEERFELELMRRTLAFRGSEEEIAAQARAAVAELGKGLPPKDVRKFLSRAFAVATVGRDETLARGVSRYFLSDVRRAPERKTYAVRFTNRPVAGAGDWVNLPFRPEESDFDRTYGGGGMAFMTTDVATGDRGNAVQGGERARRHPTTLQAVADEWGLHFVYTFYDRRVRQFESGELDAGSFESYLAPGENTPYFCFISHPKKDGGSHVMNTSYDQPGHRRVRKDDPRHMRRDVAFTDGAIVTYVAFSWDVFADRLPADGDEWDFESIFWGPVPSAWNGTLSIHGRSTWGKLTFSLDASARAKIQRAQLFKAVNAYRAEKLPKQALPDSVQEGVFSHWSDDELGDPAFYRACLEPLIAELDPVADRVKAGMSEGDVRAVASRYLTRFRNIRHEVAQLRARYLEREMTENGR